MQTILGAGGIISVELAKHLPQFTNQIRLVSRNPKQVNPTDELFKADLLNEKEVLNAVEGSEVVYLTVGLPYRTNIWQKDWETIMRNTINACKAHNAKLVFFDNVYMYGKMEGEMTETNPLRPISKKGAVRTKLVQMLRNEMEAGSLQATIARSADFYGPGAQKSVLNIVALENIAKGKKAQLLLSDSLKHSYTYTPDAGKYTALLGNTPDAYNQEWHLPTTKPGPTGKEFMQIAADIMNTKPHYMVVPKWMLHIIGWFNGDIKESMEMMYQYEADYIFNSDKYERYFNVQPTPYKEGIKATLEHYKNAKD
jgi:nucleoside-diphosphate-sugar epimerase